MLMNKTSTTTTDEREQWRTRIQRALAELQSDIPALDTGGRDDNEGDATPSDH